MRISSQKAFELGLFKDPKGNWVQPKKKAELPTGQNGGVDLESKLHVQIIEHCKLHGWLYVHSQMNKRATVGVGIPDFIIAMPGGRTIWVEAKARKEKPTIEQLGRGRHLQKLGHEHYVVWNFDEFLACTNIM